jgi:hypothetical protein
LAEFNNKGGIQMAVTKKDAETIRNLVKEGKRITRIVRDDFPEYDYWEVYSTAYGAGERGAQGVKRMITNRLNVLCEVNKDERQNIIDELDDLIWYLYNNFKTNQGKLDSIRQALGK